MIPFIPWWFLAWYTAPEDPEDLPYWQKPMTVVEVQLQMTWVFIVQDLQSTFQAIFLHTAPFMRRCHIWEHSLVFQSKLQYHFLIGFFYLTWFVFFWVTVNFIFRIPSICNGRDQKYFQSAVHTAAWRYTAFFLALRIPFWVPEHKPSLYRYFPTCWLNFIRFFRTHFMVDTFEFYNTGRRKGFTKACGFGSVSPFWDISFGTSIYDVKYSCWLPYVDYCTHPVATFTTPVPPSSIKWNWKQKIWYTIWWLGFIFLTVYAAGIYYARWGSQYEPNWWQPKHLGKDSNNP